MNPAQHEAEIRELDRLAREQAALRRVATLVASGAPAEVFASVAEEVGQLLGTELAGMARYDSDDAVTVVATWAAEGEVTRAHPLVPGPWPLEGDDVASMVSRTGRPVRIDDYDNVTGRIAEFVRDQLGVRSSVASPIVVDGRLWGVLFLHSKQTQPLPLDTESRLTGFTELVATAIANTQARAEVQRLAEEQAALRRVATLVASERSPEAVFAHVAEEVGLLLGVDAAAIQRYEADGDATVVGNWGNMAEPFPVGSRVKVDGGSVTALVHRTQRPARFDAYQTAHGQLAAGARDAGLRSAVGSPIVVNGRLWGAIVAATARAEPLPADAESRIAGFTELVAATISNVQARTEVQRLTDEQAALRRVATTVARASSPEEILAKVAEEIGLLLRADVTLIHRYERAGYATVVGIFGRPSDVFWAGRRWKVDGRSIAASVRATERPVRFDAFATAGGSIAAEARRAGVRSGIGCPIFVDERLWGVIVATSRAEPLPPGAEARIADFTELIATAISSIQAWSDLAASRARLVAAADEERRKVVRDLHDGAQQRLVHTVLTLKLARRALERDRQRARALLDQARQHARTATDELRDLAHGILPPVLIDGGLWAGLNSLSQAMSIPVTIESSVGRLPGSIEATAYFIVAEALTNVAKHSRARHATVTARLENHTLQVQVRDDGVGGARPEGSGLMGIRDRLAAIDGTLRIETPSGGGTVIAASIPVRESDVSASQRREDQAATVLGDGSRWPRSAEPFNDARSAPSP